MPKQTTFKQEPVTLLGEEQKAGNNARLYGTCK